MFKSVFNESIIKRAQEKKLVEINMFNLRDWTTGKHKTVDDSPYGGGAGMVMKVDVIDRAIDSLKSKITDEKIKIILLTPQGKKFDQKKAKKLSSCSNLLLICGHYEGFDERIRKLVDEEISIGDYVLTGGEIPAMVIVDAVTRLLPGVLGKDQSSQEESFSMEKLIDKEKIGNYLEYPHYTRPTTYAPVSKHYKNKLEVPKILLGGNHAEIEKWRIAQSVNRSKKSK